ncbi:MAG: cyanophycinase [Actinomycetota bacterium]
MRGPIALVGGAEFLPGAHDLDAWLLERSAHSRGGASGGGASGGGAVTMLPTAAAHQRPEKAVATARRHFQSLGASLDAVMVLEREDAEDPSLGARLGRASFVYLCGGDPRHLAAVLAGTPVWEAILEANAAGGVLAGSSAGAMVLCAWMAPPGSAGLERGLGLLPDLVVIPHHDTTDKSHRAYLQEVGRPELSFVGIDEATGLVLDGGRRRVLGAGTVTVYREGKAAWTGRAPAEI